MDLRTGAWGAQGGGRRLPGEPSCGAPPSLGVSTCGDSGRDPPDSRGYPSPSVTDKLIRSLPVSPSQGSRKAGQSPLRLLRFGNVRPACWASRSTAAHCGADGRGQLDQRGAVLVI